MDRICPVCGEKAKDFLKNNFDVVICPRCGEFDWKWPFDSIVESGITERQRANISAWLRENPEYQVGRNDKERLLNLPTPSFTEKKQKLMLHLDRLTEYGGVWLRQEPSWIAEAWCANDKELKFLLDSLAQELYINMAKLSDGPLDKSGDQRTFLGLQIAPQGWEYIETLKAANPDSAQGFIAMSFDPKLSGLSDALHEGIRLAGYKPKRVDDEEHAKKICDLIVAEIRKSRFVVADLTEHKNGVYYEAGFGQGLGLTVIWTCRADELAKAHFDIRQYNCIKWKEDKAEGEEIELKEGEEIELKEGEEIELKEDAVGLAELPEKLRYRIEAVLGQGPRRA